MNAPLVMLVDDEVPFVETMVKRLAKRHLEVKTAFSGQEALETLAKYQNIDVVILDVKMPGMDGIETLKKIKSGYPLTEVVMLTAHATVESAIEGMKFGAFDYLMKPCDMEQLMGKVKEAAAKKRSHEEKIREARVKEILTKRGLVAPEPDKSKYVFPQNEKAHAIDESLFPVVEPQYHFNHLYGFHDPSDYCQQHDLFPLPHLLSGKSIRPSARAGSQSYPEYRQFPTGKTRRYSIFGRQLRFGRTDEMNLSCRIGWQPFRRISARFSWTWALSMPPASKSPMPALLNWQRPITRMPTGSARPFKAVLYQ